jgi:hypothetical protein
MYRQPKKKLLAIEKKVSAAHHGNARGPNASSADIAGSSPCLQLTALA